MPSGRTADKRIEVMHAWVRRNASQLELPRAPYELQLFDAPSEEASAELQEWLELVVDNQTDDRARSGGRPRQLLRCGNATPGGGGVGWEGAAATETTWSPASMESRKSDGDQEPATSETHSGIL